ncbi:Ribonuclease HII [Hartmannibacter diazotrophicus]|uniref:Ribonuclease HII n=2 Tax=Hartmannibacter diazotrophicus TaxID=1482074 RepID=A0A2C9D344_9HYPH|nr:Ribonuclease HII [Hartmannibacter diazotrophicus]
MHRHGGPVAGLDEAGRGPLAGPVVAAAVIFDGEPPKGLDDSKKLTAKARAALFEEIIAGHHVAVACACAVRIDEINILAASMEAMEKALAALAARPAAALVDGNRLPARLGIPAEAIVKGDSRSSVIAAASIVAKVTRDRMMEKAALAYPGYGFESHKGYGSSKVHQEALAELGPCALHRQSFAPVRAALERVSSRSG